MRFRFEPDIAISVRKYEKAIEFYQQVLGMRLVRQDEGETVLRLPGATFYVEDGGDDLPVRSPTTFCFSTDDFRAAEEHLFAAGCRLSAVVEGGRMVHDPYGLAFFLCPQDTGPAAADSGDGGDGSGTPPERGTGRRRGRR
jgi:catechol 2,3-dioxygenase-like lactoylglutathione lyase family enzyme